MQKYAAACSDLQIAIGQRGPRQNSGQIGGQTPSAPLFRIWETLLLGDRSQPAISSLARSLASAPARARVPRSRDTSKTYQLSRTLLLLFLL
jgi:hypothetical protein